MSNGVGKSTVFSWDLLRYGCGFCLVTSELTRVMCEDLTHVKPGNTDEWHIRPEPENCRDPCCPRTPFETL